MSVLSFALAAAAMPAAVPSQVQIIKEGDAYVIRTLDGGKPIYTYDKDEPGKSNCVERCLAAWPAVVAPAGARPVGKWTAITRADGTGQWAYDGKPLYTFVRDGEGTATGDGMGGVWHLIPATPAK